MHYSQNLDTLYKELFVGYTDDVCKIIRASVPKNMMADIKDSIKSDRSLNLQDKYGATAVSAQPTWQFIRFCPSSTLRLPTATWKYWSFYWSKRMPT